MQKLINWYKEASSQDIREREWTDDELNELTATVVMGWVYCEEPRHPYYKSELEGKLSVYGDWFPSTDMNDAMTVSGEF